MRSNRFLLVPAVLAALAVTSLAVNEPAIGPDEQMRALAEGNNNFAFDLYAKLRTAKGNLFLSPYSISTALSLVCAGARDNTADQMQKVLRFPDIPYELLHGVDSDTGRGTAFIEPERIRKDDVAKAFGSLQKSLTPDPNEKPYELSIANALWTQKGSDLEKGFINLVKTEYNAKLSELDFVAATESARRTINQWVEKKTRNKIKNLIKPGMLNNMTRLVLTNAIYFKGAWSMPFEKAMTHPGTFTLSGGKKIEVPMMNKADRFKYAETGDLQILEMPYAGGDLVMTVLLPSRKVRLSDFEKRLTAKSLADWLGKLSRRKVIVSIPKFRTTSEFSLSSVLKSMGMTDAFDPLRADFRDINGKKDLFISAVVHKAFVEVNEEGTEAAAATGITMETTSISPTRPPIFRADRPFIFLIRQNKTGSILFIGRLANPKA